MDNEEENVVVCEEEVVEEVVEQEDMLHALQHMHTEGVDPDAAADMLLEELGDPSSSRHRQPRQQSGYVYAIRGNQVYKIDKLTGAATPIRTAGQTSPVRMQIVQPPKAPIDTKSVYLHPHPHPHSQGLGSQGLGSQDVKPIYRAVNASSAAQPGLAYRSAPSSSYAARPVPEYFQSPASSSAVNYKPSPRPPIKKKQSMGTPGGNRKPCNCNKSMCLKLYCDCFANGEFCRDCNCKDCHNNMEYEGERSKAIKASLERNPNAFKPKIGVAGKGRSDVERLHQKGCHCKKSNCLKNYCECYEAKVPCTERCKCISCRNTESDRASKLREKFSGGSSGLLHLAAAASADSRRSASPFSDDDSDSNQEPHDPKTLPWFYMTDEVVEATTLCLVAQAEEQESSGSKDGAEMEKAILREFARCLEQIIENATHSIKH